MNKEDIIRMALEAELIYDEECTSPWIEDTNLTPFLEHFAALVASAEREACAKWCETLTFIDGTGTAEAFADEVRNRGQEPAPYESSIGYMFGDKR